MRRACGQGDFLWDPMREGETWQFFLETLWTYQVVTHPSPLPPSLMHGLYEEMQGITDLALKMFMLAQQREISTGMERVNSNMIRSVARYSFRLMAPVLAALRKKDRAALSRMEDVFLPQEFEPLSSTATI